MLIWFVLEYRSPERPAITPTPAQPTLGPPLFEEELLAHAKRSSYSSHADIWRLFHHAKTIVFLTFGSVQLVFAIAGRDAGWMNVFLLNEKLGLGRFYCKTL